MSFKTNNTFVCLVKINITYFSNEINTGRTVSPVEVSGPRRGGTIFSQFFKPVSIFRQKDVLNKSCQLFLTTIHFFNTEKFVKIPFSRLSIVFEYSFVRKSSLSSSLYIFFLPNLIISIKSREILYLENIYILPFKTCSATITNPRCNASDSTNFCYEAFSPRENSPSLPWFRSQRGRGRRRTI